MIGEVIIFEAGILALEKLADELTTQCGERLWEYLRLGGAVLRMYV